MPAECHVRKLHIRTDDKTLLPRMTFVLEDAFRTASFPGVPPNGRVYIRKLDLGKHSPSASSRVLAGKIDQQFRLIRPVKIDETSHEEHSVSAVWFPDDLSPYRFMIHHLSKNKRPTAWYWSAAVRGWRPDLTHRESYSLILSQVSQHVTGIRGMSCVLEPLIVAGTVHEVIESFDSRKVACLLDAMGIRPVCDVHQDEYLIRDEEQEAFIVTPGLIELIGKSVRLWSVSDPRTTLISCLALVTIGKKPDAFNINRLFEHVSESETPAGESGYTVWEKGTETMDQNLTGISENFSPDELQESDHWVSSYSGSEKVSVSTQKKETVKPILKPIHDVADTIEFERTSVSSDETKKQNVHINEEPFNIPEEQNGVFKAEKQVDSRQDGVSPIKADQDTGFSEVRNDQKIIEKHKTAHFKEHDLKEIWPSFGGFAGEISDVSGILFIVPLMKRLGMDTLMEMYPNYSDLNIPQRIIFRCAEMLTIPFDDPALKFAGEKPEASHQFVDFVAPREWSVILNPTSSDTLDLRLGRITDVPRYRLILDDEERLVIGVWNLDNRSLPEPWYEIAKKPFGSAEPQNWSVQHLINNFVCSMKRYLRMYAHMGLFGLINRPAYISTTKTHLDVTIPFKRLDIRVRMAGLDINPGWVPWLGKVIQFHYVGGDH